MLRKTFTYLLIITAVLSFAQQDDAALWTGIKLSQEVTKEISFGYTQGLRFDNNISNLANTYSQLKGSYSLNKAFKISAAYRWAKKQNWQEELNIDNRYQFDLRYKKKFNDFSVKNRIRFQSKYTNFATSDYGFIPENQLRNELTFDYKINKKIKPYVSFEVFYPLNDYVNEINKMRYQVGGDFKITKSTSVEMFFIYQNEFNRTNPTNSFIMGTSFSIDMPSLAKKKDDEKDKDDKVKKKKSEKEKKEKVKKEKPKKEKEEEELYFPDLDD